MKENKMIETTTMKSTIMQGKYRRGDKIKTIKVSWDSARLADKPLVESSSIGLENKNHLMIQNIDTISSSINNDQGPTSMIAGQLIIYDLDEEPPNISQLNKEKGNALAQFN
ncbi:hypothetical protein LOAG_12340 [Loa loa]|uniref:Uncharacterized protein n=1 Tax=Loa loa TaxID=7209 RepID=A0A1I7V6M4_LOALO|nr:hypothetical protein LOAG_12340 [Loa loa]EFO16167.2 hypothetical protein LOAG_12340 [Loa loa]